MPGRAEVPPEKIQEVDNIAVLLKKSPVVGILNMHKVPASALQKIRHDLKDKAEIKFAKKSLLTRAVEKVEEKKILLEQLEGQPALLLTEMNPFKLYKFLEKNKSNAPAKPGDIAPQDIEVKAGPTDLMPGPAISALSGVGIPAKVQEGKIAVLRDKVVVEAGKEISADLASVLQMLKMKPMKVGLDLRVAFEDGILYGKDVLAVDEQEILNNMIAGYHNAFNLAYNSGFPTADTTEMMITNAFREAKTLALEINFVSKETIEEILAKAKRQADALKGQVGE